MLLLCGAFLSVLNQTLVNPALPAIMSETGVSATTAQWLVSGFTLVNAIVIATAAFLMDRLSTRRLFIAIFILFFVGSMLAAWGPNFAVLLAGRIFQAICAGVMTPLSMTILMRLFPVSQRGTAMGTLTLIVMFAPSIGPVVSGALTDRVGWHFMFLIMAALAFVIIVCAAVSLKNFGATHGAELDKQSVALSSAGLFMLLYALSIVDRTELLPLAAILLASAFVILFLFSRRQLRQEHPFLRIGLLADKQFRRGTIIGMLLMLSLAASSITIPIYIQTVRGMSATVAGAAMMPGSIIGAGIGYAAGKFYDRFGARVLSIIGAAVVAVGSLFMCFFDMDTTIAYVMVSYTLRSTGLMLANTPINVWAISKLDDKVLHHGNAVLNTLRQIASTLGTAVMISAMSFGISYFSAHGVAESQLAGILIAYWLSFAIGIVTLVMAIVYIKK